jgi:hypothetical protein
MQGIGICGKCNRPIKDPRSIERGFGPTCWGRIQAEHSRATGDPAEESDYDFTIDRTGDSPVLVIQDLDRGRKSVTNNMDAILKRIAADTGCSLEQIPIVYKDSDGNFDGVQISESGAASFHPLTIRQRVTNRQEAIQAALRRQERKGAEV